MSLLSSTQHPRGLHHDVHGAAQSHPVQCGGTRPCPACGLGVPSHLHHYRDKLCSSSHTVTTYLPPKPCYMPVAWVSASRLGTRTALGLVSCGQGSVPHG